LLIEPGGRGAAIRAGGSTSIVRVSGSRVLEAKVAEGVQTVRFQIE